MFQQNHPMHGHSPLSHLRLFKKRAAFKVALLEKQTIAEGTVAFRFEKPNSFQTSAMKTLLTNAGVREEHIHAEEFTGFNLNDMHTMGLMHRKKKHVG